MSVETPSLGYDPDLFPESDGVPVETDWHQDEMFLLKELAWQHNAGRTDFYAATNMFIYYDRNDPRKVVGPDFFFVRGVPSTPRRRIWAAWAEGRLPDVIIELLSPTTKHKDRKTNKDIYERTFRTPEYFLYDPDTESLDGWRLSGDRYEPIVANEDGWMWSEGLGLWLGPWHGDTGRGEPALWLRFYDADGRLVPTRSEAARQQAEREHRRAERARRKAEREHELVKQERRRAETLEAEVARLKALLGQQQSDADE